jgi:phosphoesterase RecJ-like protein
LENTDFKHISERLRKPSRILITTHTNPDGDAIGSSLALWSYLKKTGHQVSIMIPDPFPEFLAWLSGCENILIYSKDPVRCNEEIRLAEIIIAADYNNFGRLNEAGEKVLETKALKILIDHHLNPAPHFDLKISISKVSSTSELIFDFIVAMGDKQLLDKQMAECLYVGIVTDTGSFSYSCNYVKTYLAIAELYRLGIDGEHIHRLVYDTYSESRLRLLGLSVSDNLTVLPEYHTAFITLPKEDLDRFNYQIGDTEGVVNYALSIKDINLAALFMEREGIVKVSFRSKGNFSVDTLAREHFDGGGHRNASGANCTTGLEETVTKFKNLLPGYRAALKSVY